MRKDTTDRKESQPSDFLNTSSNLESGGGTTSSEPLPPVLEVWFAGCHSDVGGSAAEDMDYSLADISLRWMIKQIVLSKCGIKFDDTALKRAGLNVLSTIPTVPTSPTEEGSQAETGLPTPRAGPSPPGEDGNKEYTVREGNDEDVEERVLPRGHNFDSKIHDEMTANRGWWILEILPMKFTWQRADGVWVSRFGYTFFIPVLISSQFSLVGFAPFFRFHKLGQGRKIWDEQPNFHVSVRERMADAQLDYTPRARWERGTERYVD